MMNLFSSFDPSSFTKPTFMVIMMMPMLMQMSSSKMTTLKNMIFKNMKKEITPNLESKNQKSSTNKFVAMFMLLSMINLSGLIPSSFSLTTQMWMNLPIAIIMWTTTNMFSTMKKNKVILSHLVPNGTPMPLAPFMVMIELVSNLIRPITLSVRLTANMVAGHILISLMESFVINSNPNKILSFMMASILTILETGVSIIQAYVYSMLISLYFSENH